LSGREEGPLNVGQLLKQHIDFIVLLKFLDIDTKKKGTSGGSTRPKVDRRVLAAGEAKKRKGLSPVSASPVPVVESY